LQVTKRLADSAIDAALGYVWPAVGGAVVTAAVTVWLFVKSGQAQWIYPLAKYAAAFSGGWLSLTLLILLLTFIKSRRLKALEQAKNLKFVSKEKGFLDHLINRDKAQSEFNLIIFALSKEVANIGKTTSKESAKIDKAKRNLGDRAYVAVHKIAAKTAAKLNRHSETMEQDLTEFERITDSLIESSIGYLTWFTPDTPEKVGELSQYKSTLNALLTVTQTSVDSMEGFRDSQNSLRGISQELNTAINRLVHVTEGVIAVMNKAENLWQALIKMIDTKLTD
jgi:putative transposon-encoded protein